MTQHLAARGLRDRSRPTELADRTGTGSFTELRVLEGWTAVEHVRGHVDVQSSLSTRARQKPQGQQRNVPPLGIKTAETAVVTGIVRGANEQVMAWKPQETAGVEEPPNKPGLAVLKEVDRSEAEPGDVVTFTVHYRNMGNVPIGAVSIMDNLLPRFEYVKGSAQGPRGSLFTATDNEVGSSELRWDLPGDLAPGAEGTVSFQVRVR